MKKLMPIVGLLFISSITFATDGQPDVICNNEGGVELKVEKLGYDADGALFQGTITKNGRTIRNSKMRRIALSSGFGLYAVGRNNSTSWRVYVSFDDSSLRTVGIDDQTYYSSINKVSGLENTWVTCNQSLPLEYWRK